MLEHELQVIKTVEHVIGHVFDVDPNELDGSSSCDTIKGWDSMGHLNLIIALEAQFGVSVSIDDAMEMVSVEKIKTILQKYGVPH